MAKIGVAKKSFPYAADGINVEQIEEGRTLSFPDRIYDGLEACGYIGPAEAEPVSSSATDVVKDQFGDEVPERAAKRGKAK